MADLYSKILDARPSRLNFLHCRPPTKLREGNVFTDVRLFTGWRGASLAPGPMSFWRGVDPRSPSGGREVRHVQGGGYPRSLPTDT